MANYYNAQYGSKLVGLYLLFKTAVNGQNTAFDYMRLFAYGTQQGVYWLWNERYWPAMKADMQARMDDALDDGMIDEEWEQENDTEMLPPGPGTNIFSSASL